MIDHLNAALEGRYHVVRELGRGGMATVYLAEDIKHGRQVALKVLRPELAAVVGAERFLGEIRTTANLEDPHILPLYDSGEADGFLFYVMPYVEGDTLRDRLERERQLPVAEAVEIARKVARALQFAHQNGVVHRDIKPANILMRRGEPLVADFGIALALSEAGDGRLTETGLSMGTPHYMSPEQASGERGIDPRSDVYALACVLFEMLTGEPPHAGPTAQSVLAKILTEPPRRVRELRSAVPANVDAALAQALEKLPADRMASPAAFVEALDDAAFRYEGGESSPRDRRRAATPVPASGRGWKLAAAAFGLTTAALAGWLGLSGPRVEPDGRVFRGSLVLPDGQNILMAQLGSSVALSPDGRTLVYTGENPTATWQLWARPSDALRARRLQGTDASWSPVFAPDGERIAYTDPTSGLTVMDLRSGSARLLADSAVAVLDWADDGFIYFFRGVTLGNVWRVGEAAGSVPEPVPVVSGEPGPTAEWGPGKVLPGGRSMVITHYPATLSLVNGAQVMGVHFDTGERIAITQGTDPRYLDDGVLLWGDANGTLLAARFDPERMRLLGSPVTVADSLLLDATGVMHYAVANDGTLVYRTGGSAGGNGRLLWVGRDGSREPAADLTVGLTVGLWDAVALSPDGSRVALSLAEGASSHLWTQPLGDDAPPNRITFSGVLNVRPRWSADGERLTFITDMAGSGLPTQLWTKAADGTGPPEPLLVSGREVEEGELSPDGEWVVYRLGGTATNRDIYTRRVGDGEDGEIPLVATTANERAMALSPDGRWIAYVSDDTGRDEIFVSPFPDVGSGRWQVSSGGGHSPVWGRTGREIFYVGTQTDLIAARYTVSRGSFVVTGTERLFSTTDLLTGSNHPVFSVAPDDQRFLMISLGTERGELIWIENWGTELRRMLREAR